MSKKSTYRKPLEMVFNERAFTDETRLREARGWRINAYNHHLEKVHKSRSARTVREAHARLMELRHELAVLGAPQGMGVGHA